MRASKPRAGPTKRPASGPAPAFGAKQDKGTKERRTRSEKLTQFLESEILSGAILPGTRLDEQSLATRFGMSRTPVREALRHLASSGLVHIRAHQGAVVTQLTLAELLEMFQVMAELEGLGARLAARRIGKQEMVELRESHEACHRHAMAGDEDAFFQENGRLHDIILSASRNRFLIDKVQELRRRVDPYRRYVTKQPGVMEKSIDEHAAVIAAIEAGDGVGAHDAMRAHLNMLGGEAGDFIAILSHMDGAVELQTGRGRRAPRQVERL